MTAILETCCGCRHRKPVELVHHVGLFCDECRVILSSPFTLDNCIQSESISVMSEQTHREFRDRAAKLRRMALRLIENERIASDLSQ